MVHLIAFNLVPAAIITYTDYFRFVIRGGSPATVDQRISLASCYVMLSRFTKMDGLFLLIY